MRAALALALAAASGCSGLFDVNHVPEGYACSAQNTCPPGQQCVPGEHVCRTPCTQTTMGGMTGPMQNGQCQNIDSNGSTGYACDYDHFCRPTCGNSNGTCAGCSGSDVCDPSVNICRPACTGGCPTSWGCVALQGASNGGGSATCIGCRPLATTTVMPPAFAPLVSYAGATTSSLAVGDLAGTGHADVVTVDGPADKIYVDANDGTGALQSPVGYAVAPNPFSAVVADMNRDGKADVVVAVANGPTSYPALFPGNGDHTLGAQLNGPSVPTTELAVGDFDGDGKPDLAIGGSGTGQLSVVTADGMGGLKLLATPASSSTASFVRIGVADFNGDQKLDLWADDEHMGVFPYLNNGASPPGFSMGSSPPTQGTRTSEAALDADGDGKTDFIVAGSMPTGPNGSMAYSVLVAYNNGGGAFNTTSNGVSLPAAGALVVADFDGDGRSDAALLETQSMGKSNVDILTDDGKTLIESETIAIPTGVPSSIAVGDLDGDGKPDLVVGLAGGGVAVLINQTPAPSP